MKREKKQTHFDSVHFTCSFILLFRCGSKGKHLFVWSQILLAQKRGYFFACYLDNMKKKNNKT